MVAFHSCHLNNTYEKNIEVPGFKWDYQYMPEFAVQIDDTVSQYNMYVNIRHQESYAYLNLWMVLHSSNPTGQQQKERLQLYLAKPDGQWIGEGINGIWMVSVPIKQKIKFPKKGLYTFALEHDMRSNPLQAILNVGFKLEKVQ
jgi:gliding motility-associated lipoprotein GldH